MSEENKEETRSVRIIYQNEEILICAFVKEEEE